MPHPNAKPDARYSLIVFDWDGTLLDSATGIAISIQEASREMGLEVPSRERASHVIGLGLMDALRHAVPDLPEKSYAEFAERYRKHFLTREEGMDLFPGVPELLAGLQEAGYTLAVATGKSRKGLERALRASGLGAHFAATRCADESRSKPDPAMLFELMGELSRAPGELLMIGDTSHDLEMATNAAVDAVGVTYGAHPEASLRACSPRGVVGSVAELSAWLAKHG
jgi:phosphoglycolate phosphatase